MKSKHLKNKKVNKKNENIKKNKKTKKVFLNLLSIIFFCLMVYSGINIFLWWDDNQVSNNIMEKISKTITENDNKIDFNKLKEINNETIAYIKVNGTNISYPVVKTTNNDFYINHSFDKSENGAGWIFADYRNKFNESEKNLVIYGHNRRDGSMFSTLKNALNEEWYNNKDNLVISLITEAEGREYQIFSIYKIEKEDYYTTIYFTDKEYEKFIKDIKQRSIKKFNIDVGLEDEILTLSTCDNNNNYRVVVHAKRIK